MKKYLVPITFLIIISQFFPYSFATSSTVSAPVKVAIKKYKSGNYTGCLQDMQILVKRDPSNAVAYYYMAMAYAQAGKKDEAISSYQKVLGLKPNATLFTYAAKGKRCLETPSKCTEATQSSDIDKMVKTPFGDGLSSTVRVDLEKKHLDVMKNEINADKDINNYELKKFKDYSNQHSEVKTDDKTAAKNSAQPSNDEIVAALRVLDRAGLNPYAQQQNMPNQYQQMAGNQSAEMAQLNMLMNSNNQGNNNNNNSMMNMLPMMLAQSKAGKNGGSSYNPQMIQSMMMNSMLPDMNFNTNDNNK